MKKIIQYCTFLVALILMFSITAFAVTLSYWYATVDNDLDLVLYQPSSKTTYSYQNLQQSTSTNTAVINHIYDAVSTWRTKLGISLTSNSDATSPKNAFVVYAGPRSELLNIYASLKSTEAGKTLVDNNYRSVGTATYGNSSKNVGVYTDTIKVLVDTSNTASTGWANLIAHEIGHAFGWYGHSSSSADLMYKVAQASVTAPSTRDANQLKQIYNAYR